MRKILFIGFLFIASTVQAQTTTTTTLSLGGVVNCQSIVLTVTRVQSSDTKTNIYFEVRECDTGYTIPNKVIEFYSSPIQNTDFTTDKSSAHLITNSPYGPIKIDWNVTTVSHSTYDATWTWYAPNNNRQTQNDDFKSAHAVGNIGNYTVDRNGYFTVSVFKK